MKTWKKLGTGLWLAASLLVFLPAGSGCVAKRGFTFGHWAGTGEKISLIRVYNLNTALLPPRDAKVVVLPPLSQLPDVSQKEFKEILTKSLRNHVPVPIFEVDPLGPLSDYVREDNLAPTMGLFDFQEAARLGRLLGASHVLCVRVQNFRLHPPQVLAVYLGLVEASSGKVVVELEASYDASEQLVVMAMDDYLQSRRARGYDKTNLEIMMRSPIEFQTFVCTQCSKALAETLWP